jgi:hypothetical protein
MWLQDTHARIADHGGKHGDDEDKKAQRESSICKGLGYHKSSRSFSHFLAGSAGLILEAQNLTPMIL